MSESSAKPYRMWLTTAPFRKNGTPVVGSMGSSLRRVVIIDADEFTRLMSDHADMGLRNTRFEVADLD